MNVKLAIATTTSLNLPSGTVPKYRFWYQGGPLNQTSPYQDEPITQPFSDFLDVPPGSYTGACVVIDQNGANVSPIVLVAFVVPDPGINVNAPATITATITP